MKGIFYNSKSAVCSIYESGRMVYDALSKSDKYRLDYTEEQSLNKGYDFMVVNQHATVNDWITPSIAQSFDGVKFCIVTEVNHNGNPIKGIPEYFDKYIVLDPTIEDADNIFGFPRPLEKNDSMEEAENDIPIIGSFGLPTPGKEWSRMVDQVQIEFENAIIRINIPHATHVPNSGGVIADIRRSCQSRIKKEGIKLELTSNYMSKSDLIKWCSMNTLNCFFYNRNHSHPTGLCAVADQAISSKRPLLVTADTTFRHILKYSKPFPEIGMREAILMKENVHKMYNDWSQENFRLKFEKILLNNA